MACNFISTYKRTCLVGFNFLLRRISDVLFLFSQKPTNASCASSNAGVSWGDIVSCEKMSLSKIMSVATVEFLGCPTKNLVYLNTSFL